MIKSVGDAGPEDFDSANVPVDIWLTKFEPEPRPNDEEWEQLGRSWQRDWEENMALWDEGFRWVLQVGNYMPRKSAVHESVRVYATEREELVELIKKHILPMYETAIAQITAIVNNEAESLYYWESDSS